MKLGQVVRGYRKETKMSQERLAEMIGISQEHVSAIERGKTKKPRSQVAQKLARFFNLEPNSIANGMCVPKPSSKLTVGDILWGLRRAKGITINRLSKEIGIDCSALYRIEQNKHKPRVTTAITLANYFNVSYDFIWGEGR
jgi:transcriptional regulator with XRE-family HTH domain